MVKAKIIETLRSRGSMTTSEINDIFGRNKSASEIREALDNLVKTAQLETITEQTAGRPRIIYLTVQSFV